MSENRKSYDLAEYYYRQVIKLTPPTEPVFALDILTKIASRDLEKVGRISLGLL